MSDTIQGVKTLDVRLIHTHGTEAEWATKTSFVPEKGELIVYDADEIHTYARYKIGDGVTTLINLPFLNKLTPGRGIEITDDHTITFAHPEILDAASMVGISSVGNTTTHNIATKSDFNMFKEELEETITNLEDKYALKEEISQPMVSIKYADLVSLRDNADLVPGQLYRIVDYRCTTTQENTWSAEHQFDIIVRADSEKILNENAWATYHYNEDGSVDGYFQAVEKEIISASLTDGTEIADIPIIFTERYGESYLSLHGEWGDQTYFDVYEHPKWAIDVPVVYDPDPDETGCDCIYFYEDSITRIVGNSLVSIEAIMDPTGEEVLYVGSHNVSEFDDVLVYFDYQADTPIMRKTEAFLYEVADMDELLVYNGDVALDGITYNQWNKLEPSGDVFKILTNKIVENGKFIYSLDQLRNAVIYESLDKWGEYDANTMDFNGYYRYTRNVVNAELNERSVINANLTAWELKYCLDNDENKFYWADIENGRGVIYYMKDEYNNECGYDFKNVLFGGWYTFNWNMDFPLDLSIFGNNGNLVNDEGYAGGVYNNVIKPWYNAHTQQLNNIVFNEDPHWDSGFFYGCYGNQFGHNCYNMSFENNCKNNVFGSDCFNNTFEKSCLNNTFGTNCTGNTFGAECLNNTFGVGCSFNTFGTACRYNVFGTTCSYNVFGNNCDYNTFENCCNNTFENYCDNNIFEGSCDNNIFKSQCRYIKVISSRHISLGGQSTHAIIEHVCGNESSKKYIQTGLSDLTIVRPSKIEEVLV